MKAKALLTTLMTTLCLSANAQTVVWELKPTTYNDISRLGRNLYVVKHNGKVGLINSDGTIVAPIDNDQIGDLYEHKALVTRTDGHGERVAGILTDDGVYHGFATSYYTLNGQKFYSDGLLSVADERGNLGYIDDYGKAVVGFEGKYSRIKPFTEGFAAVMKNKKYVLIDKDGNEAKFMYGGNGIGPAIGGCTNVYQGKAYVYDEFGGADRSYYLYDAKAKSRLEKTGRIKNTATDYLYCYQSVTGRTKDVPFKKMVVKAGQVGLSPVTNKGLYGYEESGKTVLPAQLSAATPFEDNLAIVTLNGQIGILKYIPGNGFVATPQNGQLTFMEGNKVDCAFTLLSPSVWRDKAVDVKMRDEKGNIVALVKKSDNNYSFTLNLQGSCKKQFEVAVFAEGLKLFEGTVAYSFTMKERPKPDVCHTCGKKLTECQYKGAHPKPEAKTCPTCGKKISECPYQGVH